MLGTPHLHVVASGSSAGADAPKRSSSGAEGADAAARKPSAVPGPDRGDLAVLGMLFGVNLVPLVGDALTRGRWGAGTLGLATAGALVTGRELLLEVRSLLRRRNP